MHELLKGERSCKSERIPDISLRKLRTVTVRHSVRRGMPTMPTKWLRSHCTTGTWLSNWQTNPGNLLQTLARKQ